LKTYRAKYHLRSGRLYPAAKANGTTLRIDLSKVNCSKGIDAVVFELNRQIALARPTLKLVDSEMTIAFQRDDSTYVPFLA
jgi:hypothetical protein